MEVKHLSSRILIVFLLILLAISPVVARDEVATEAQQGPTTVELNPLNRSEHSTKRARMARESAEAPEAALHDGEHQRPGADLTTDRVLYELPRHKKTPDELPDQPPQTLKALPRNILHDQKFLWLRPFRLNRTDIPWAAGVLGTTAGLFTLDRRVGQGLSDSPPGGGYAFSHRVGQLSGAVTVFSIPTALYLVGRARDDGRARTTGLLGLQAVADTQIIVQILKTATQRPRPTFSGGRLRDHNADGEFFTGGRSFPSGHSAGAWALATVLARQYHDSGWVPPTAYALAGLVAVSRVTARRHFPADIFVGSVLGYLIGRRVSNANSRESSNLNRRWNLATCTVRDGGVALTFVWEF